MWLKVVASIDIRSDIGLNVATQSSGTRNPVPPYDDVWWPELNNVSFVPLDEVMVIAPCPFMRVSCSIMMFNLWCRKSSARLSFFAAPFRPCTLKVVNFISCFLSISDVDRKNRLVFKSC